MPVSAGAIASWPLLAVPAAEAAEAMPGAGVRRLVVVDGDGSIVGLLPSDDLLQALVEPLKMLATSFRAAIAREESLRATLAFASPRPVLLPMGTHGMRA